MIYTNFSNELSVEKRHKDKAWAPRHDRAIVDGSGCTEFGKSWLAMATGWIRAMDDYRKQYESPIGDDGYGGPEMEIIGRGLRNLLNFELGQSLDMGTLDGALLRVAEANGLDLEKAKGKA